MVSVREFFTRFAKEVGPTPFKEGAVQLEFYDSDRHIFANRVNIHKVNDRFISWKYTDQAPYAQDDYREWTYYNMRAYEVICVITTSNSVPFSKSTLFQVRDRG